MSFFSKLGKAASKVGAGVGKVLKTGASVASFIPGVGTIVGAAANIVGEVLDPTQEAAIVEAVAEQKTVKTKKIEQTIAKSNPSIDAATLQVATQQMTQKAIEAVPTAKIDDSGSLTSISTSTKIIQWVKSNLLLVGGGLVAAYVLFFNKKGGRRRGW